MNEETQENQDNEKRVSGAGTSIDEMGGADIFSDEDAANDRAEVLGCEGSHAVDIGGTTFWRSCESKEAWLDALKGPGLVGAGAGEPVTSVGGGGGGGGGGGKSQLPENLECRAATLELRETPKGRKLVGYAAVFDNPYMVGDFEERIDSEAFARTLDNGADVRAMIDHDAGRILGRTKAGTLRLETDAHGLRSEIDLPNTQEGRDIAELVRRGDLDAMSFGFVTKQDAWEEARNGEPRKRTIQEVELFDVSVVAFPANDQTSVSLRKRRDRQLDAYGYVVKEVPASGNPETLRLILEHKIKNGPGA